MQQNIVARGGLEHVVFDMMGGLEWKPLTGWFLSLDGQQCLTAKSARLWQSMKRGWPMLNS